MLSVFKVLDTRLYRLGDTPITQVGISNVHGVAGIFTTYTALD
jgi:hypothetical protein